MSRVLRSTISSGALLELRRQLELANRGKNVLEMKRDQLVKEIYGLISEASKRKELERKLATLYSRIRKAYVFKGPDNIKSCMGLSKPPEFRILYKSFLGVRVPEVKLTSSYDVEQIPDTGLRELAREVGDILIELVLLGAKEATIEYLSEELMYVNRIVNALERKLLPQLRERIRYISIRLQEKALEEFVRIKRTRDKIQKVKREK